MVEVYRKGDFKKPDRRKANRDRVTALGAASPVA
jgi:hypothetical protein